MNGDRKRKNNLLDVLKRVSEDKKLLDAFLEDLFTPKEYSEISRRWEIVQRLDYGETQRTIADDLGVGIATVTRGAKELADPKGGFAQVLDILEDEKSRSKKSSFFGRF